MGRVEIVIKGISIIFVVLSICQAGIVAASEDNYYLQWERFRIRPSIELGYLYDDNVYRENNETVNERIMTISPSLGIDWALTNDISTSAYYRYTYESYSEADNFEENHHNAVLSAKWNTTNGSLLQFGAKADDTAVQPFSRNEASKDYLKLKGYLYMKFPLGDMVDIHSRYYHSVRRFSEEANQEDDYDRDSVKVNVIYKKFLKFPLLLGYHVTHHCADERNTHPFEMTLHRYHVGALWEASDKIIGELKLGYLNADIEEDEAVEGFSSETNLTYAFSEITSFKIEIEDTLVPSTVAERETEGYYEYSKVGVSVHYAYFDPLRVTLGYAFHQKDFPQRTSDTEARVDTITKFETRLIYGLRKWCDVILRYEHQRYDSNRNILDYEENRVSFRLKIEI